VDARDAEGNPYAHLISGLKIIVDVNTLEVLEIEDHH
jgi:primary-amine oxidase